MDAEKDFLRSQLEITRDALAKTQEKNDFLRNRLILEQVDRAFEKAGGNPEIESDQVRAMLGMFGRVELVGGEAGFRRQGDKELAPLSEAMKLMKETSLLAPMFSTQAQKPPGEKGFENELGSFRRI